MPAGLVETEASIQANGAFVERRDIQHHPARAVEEAGKLEASQHELLPEPTTGEIRPHAKPVEQRAVARLEEVEADEGAVVVARGEEELGVLHGNPSLS